MVAQPLRPLRQAAEQVGAAADYVMTGAAAGAGFAAAGVAQGAGLTSDALGGAAARVEGAAATALGALEAGAAGAARLAAGGVGRAGAAARKGARAAVPERVLRATASLRARLGLNPSDVAGLGGDFSADGEGLDAARMVVLRVEVVRSGEVKAVRALSWFLTIAAICATGALAWLKTDDGSYESLVAENAYFKATAGVLSVYLALLLGQLVAFSVRYARVARAGRVWSSRRLRASRAAFVAVSLAAANVAVMLANAAVTIPQTCAWYKSPSMVMGFVSWSILNIFCVLLIVCVHGGALWRAPRATPGAGGGLLRQLQQSHGALVMDGPWTLHIAKIALGAVFQASLALVLWTLLDGEPPVSACEAALAAGELADPTCAPERDTKIFLALTASLLVLYVAIYIWYSWRAAEDIKRLPYAETRFARILFGISREQIGPVFFAFGGCTLLLLLIHLDSCWTYVETWLGVIPLTTMNTAMALVLGFYLIPVGSGRSANLLRAWLQEFSWTEAAAPGRVALRNARLAGSAELAAEPIFSVELAVQLLYWANLVYSPQRGDLPDADAAALAAAELGAAAPALGAATSLKGHALSFSCAADAVEAAVDAAVIAEVGGAGAGASVPFDGEPLPAGHGSLPAALALFPGLVQHRVVFEPRSDTRALVAWGGGRLVVAFKGTSSFENVKTDLSMFKKSHPPARTAALSATFGLRLLKVPVRVHGGFLAAFQAVDAAVLAAAGEAVAAAAAAGEPPPRLLVTGHSLGGALATLAAHALVTKFPELAPRAAVYTYGAPRVGNRAFALEFDALVPDCFALINDQDPVPRVPKGNFKRVGKRVVLNELGDVAVRPGHLEAQLLARSALGEVADHAVEGYRASFAALIKSQFDASRALGGGEAGAAALAEAVDLDAALMARHCDPASLRDVALTPTTLEEVARRAAKAEARAGRPGLRVSCAEVTVGCWRGGGGGGDGDGHAEVVAPAEAGAEEVKGALNST